MSESSEIATAKAIVANAKALGLLWDMRLGTVAQDGEQVVPVRLDGDTNAISMMNMTGFSLATDTRVYTLSVPPGGNYVVGTIDMVSISVTGSGGTIIIEECCPPEIQLACGGPGGNTTLVTSTGTGINPAVPSANWTEENQVTLATSVVYRLDYTAPVQANNTNGYVVTVRLGRAASGGTVIGQSDTFAQAIGGVARATAIGYNYLVAASPLTTYLTMAITQRSGSANASIISQDYNPVMITITALGTTTELPDLAAIAMTV